MSVHSLRIYFLVIVILNLSKSQDFVKGIFYKVFIFMMIELKNLIEKKPLTDNREMVDIDIEIRKVLVY